MREILEEELPGVSISTSSDILPEIFEHERFSTTVANAVLSPLIGGYVQRLQSRLEEGGYDGDVLLLHSGGGVMTPKTAEKLAVRLASSGIAAGAIASRHIAMLCGYRELDRPRHGRDEHRHLARLPGAGADHEGVVRRVRLPDLLPVDRGADDRRRRRLAGLDRRGRLAPQRPAVGGREPRARLLPARQRRGHEHRRQRRARPPRRGADRRRDDARRRRRRALARGARRQGRARARWTPRRRSSRSRTRTWPTPCG